MAWLTESPPVGFVDSIGRYHVKGWAWDPRQPDAPVHVEVRARERLVAVGPADQFRADVVQAGVRTGKQGFDIWFDEPLSLEDVGLVQVLVSGTGVTLPLSGPLRLEAELPPVYDRLLAPRCESPFMEQIIERDGISPERAALLRTFSRDGLLKFKIKDPTFDQLADEILESLRDQYGGERRLQDAWTYNQAVRTLACLPEVLELLELLYGRPPIPMQTLNFPVGTEQSTHSDSVHFNCIPQRFMCGVWVAFEPITSCNGPLHYYPGSHRLPVIDLDDLGLVADGTRWSANYEAHQEVLHELLRLQGTQKEVLEADRGEAIVWAANLCHGGEPIADPGSSRHSQVTHYYFEGCAYYSPMQSNVLMGKVSRPDRRDIRTGEPIVPMFGHDRIPLDIPLDGTPKPAAETPPTATIAPATPRWQDTLDEALKQWSRARRRLHSAYARVRASRPGR